MIDFSKFEEFEWDEWNLTKNKVKHGVEKEEAEQIFGNKPLIFFDDLTHSNVEKRFGAFGKTDKGRKLVVYFTIRQAKIRVISIHNQSKKDKRNYEVEEVKLHGKS